VEKGFSLQFSTLLLLIYEVDVSILGWDKRAAEILPQWSLALSDWQCGHNCVHL